MDPNHPDAALRVALQTKHVLRLTLRERDYGLPCPSNRWQVTAAIDELLKPSGEGMILGLDVVDVTADDVLIIGVMDPATALAKLRDLLKRLNLPAGATLVLDGGAENLIPDLPPRDELVRRATDTMTQMVAAECIGSAPSDWKAGTLTIQCDGDWLGYQLKNAQSMNPATISGRLRDLCEELAVLMWRSGNRWREAVLQFEGKRFTLKFSYEEPLHPIPRPAPAAVSVTKPWWKFW